MAQIEICNERTRRAAAKDGFKVLGTFVTFDNKLDVELENRLSRADRALWANWGLLGCTTTPLSTILAVFKATVNATVFWCAGSWNLTREQNERLRACQMRHIRRMLKIRRGGGEAMGDFLHRASGKI